MRIESQAGFVRPSCLAACICEVCGVAFARRTRGTGDSNRCCSRDCGFELQRRERRAARDDRLSALKAMRRAARQRTCESCGADFEAQPTAKYCSTSCANRAHGLARAQPAATRTCVECQTQFTPSYGDKRRKYCSDGCAVRRAHRISKGLARAAGYGVKAETIDPIAIMERDGWCCHICGGQAPRELRGTFHADAPEMDHIVPLAQGGDHVASNVACAYRRCNIEKGDGRPTSDGPPQRRWVHRQAVRPTAVTRTRIRRPFAEAYRPDLSLRG